MFTMERKYRYLFTLCLIIGFQIHVPVTMHPTIVDLHSSLGPGHVFSSSDLDQSQFLGSGKNSPAETASQAEKDSGRGLNIAEYLSGLDGLVDLNQAKSAQSELNRLSSDLVGVRVKQIEARLSNISGEITTKKAWANRRQQNSQQRRPTSHKTEDVDKTYINKTISSMHNFQRNVINGMFWSPDLEKKCPERFSEINYVDWKRKMAANDVIKMEDGCGSMQNRLVTFNDSTKACVRYRMNTELMQGDIYSFYLGKLLNMRYTPPSGLAVPVNSKSWRRVKTSVETAGWMEHKPAIVSQFVPELDHVYMPVELRHETSQLRPENYTLEKRPTAELCQFVQWTDLVVFDYICGNLDRLVNNLYNLKWNSKMLEKPIHNLMKNKLSGLFLYLDNESGLFHGYRLLDSYAGYHKRLLESVCVFRKSTVDAIERLHKGGNAGEELQNLFEASELQHYSLPRMPKKTMSILRERIADVYQHIQLCRNQFTGVYSKS